MRKLIVASLIVALLLATTAVAASAHRLTVEPPGQQEAVFDDAVSTGWAQAHCNAEAPEQATANSGGVVTFTPAEALPCPDGPGDGAPGR
jgi:hypothetical protein